MGGTVELDSVPGKGSTFSFVVRLRCFDASPSAPVGSVEPEPADRGEDGYTGRFRDCCLLLVEDVEINREIVSALLEDTQIDIVYAEDGLKAVEAFTADPQRYDIIFMDVQMPVMDGYEATRRIRELDVPEAKSVPIIALTANVFREDQEKALASGMNGHLGKPLSSKDMFAALTAYLP
jgi:CheY-like chemotaxis protein